MAGMPDWLSVVLLAVLQGLTEFLPVSSSGHLVIAEHLMGFSPPGLRLEMVLHLGTVVSVCWCYRRRLAALATGVRRGDAGAAAAVRHLLLATAPAALLYLLAGNWLEKRFEQPRMAAAMLMVTGLALLSLRLRRAPPRRAIDRRRALAVGMAQAVAILPGISRSGATIVTARQLGTPPEEAAEFSLLLSLPILLGGALLVIMRPAGPARQETGWGLLLLGAAVAAAVGCVAIRLLLRVLAGERFWLFGFYCLAAGAWLLATL